MRKTPFAAPENPGHADLTLIQKKIIFVSIAAFTLVLLVTSAIVIGLRPHRHSPAIPMTTAEPVGYETLDLKIRASEEQNLNIYAWTTPERETAQVPFLRALEIIHDHPEVLAP